MIQITEAQLHSVSKNVNQELIIKLRIKPEDYNQELEDSLYLESWKKTPMAVVMQEFQNIEQKPTIWEKRAKLAWLMIRYAEQEKTDIKTEVNKLYIKHWITSRTQLAEYQLDEEIKSYQAGLQYN
jgi:hypothetical protein